MHVTLCIDPYIVTDIEALLLAQEERLKKYKELHLVQANLASTKSVYVPSSRFIHGATTFQNHRQ